MARISIAICLVLVVALLSHVYETKGQGQEPYSLRNYLSSFPKTSKEFEPFASKGLLQFIGVLEGKTPATVEFKNFYTKLRDYISDCFKPAAPGSVPAPEKSQQLFMAISALKGSKQGTSFDSWMMIEALVSLEKLSIEMKKISSPNVMPEAEWFRLYGSLKEWAERIGLFVKSVSDLNGKPLDLAQLDVEYTDPTYSALSKQAGLKSPVAFSLPSHMKNFPKISKDFEAFAYKGMTDFVRELEAKCLANIEFKDFFTKVNDYMAVFKTITPETLSVENIKISESAMKLFVASSSLNGTKVGISDPWKLLDGLVSMGEVLVAVKKNGTKDITVVEIKQLTSVMLKWARALSQFVKTASENRGVTMDLSSFDNFYNSNGLKP